MFFLSSKLLLEKIYHISGDVFVDDSALDSDDGSEVFSVLPMLSIR